MCQRIRYKIKWRVTLRKFDLQFTFYDFLDHKTIVAVQSYMSQNTITIDVRCFEYNLFRIFAIPNEILNP